MIKIVDKEETTIQVVQEIYNDDGLLVERHQKFPVDSGHEILVEEEADDDHNPANGR